MPVTSLLYREIEPQKPEEIALRLSNRPHVAFLDSAMEYSTLGRYSFVASDPFGVFSIMRGKAYWNDEDLSTDPFTAMRDILRRFAVEHQTDLPPFQTGGIGYFCYELGRLIEVPSSTPHPEADMPDLVLAFYDVVFAHDHAANRSFILSSGFPETDPAARHARAGDRLGTFIDLIGQPARPPIPSPPVTDWTGNFTRQTFESAVRDVIERILSGDIFQANIAQRFEASLPTDFDPFAFYWNLRNASPATFAAYLKFGKVAIASNSPERFITLAGGRIEARPIKGTSKRSDEPEEDNYLANSLFQSVKNRAENTMIVDLLRNDLSRIAKPFSVKVPMLCGLESYANVHHLVSVVEAQLDETFDAVDLIKATFPGGSITGAPKIKAMEIIGEIERVPRGVYCGAIGAFGFNGRVDLNVAIRTVTFHNHLARFHAGGGITALSEPEAEYDETLTKAERIFKAFGATAPSRK
ncbi:MAG: aminodeoxychorismate synthase component I [Hyphomicrobiales bacterium]